LKKSNSRREDCGITAAIACSADSNNQNKTITRKKSVEKKIFQKYF